MSYDIDLFVPTADADAVTLIEQAAFYHQDPRTELNQQLVTALTTDNPHFEVYSDPDAIILTDPNDGIQLSLYSHTAHLALPYWHTDARIMRLAFGTLGRYLRFFTGRTTYQTYDPQLGRVVDIDRDFDEMLYIYRRTIEQIHGFHDGYASI